jgi:hypothetical protein
MSMIVGRVDLLGEDLAQGLVATGLEVVLVGPRLVEVQRGVDDVVFLRHGADRAVLIQIGMCVCHGLHFSASRISSTFLVSSFSW